jgi:hypothetical protein
MRNPHRTLAAVPLCLLILLTNGCGPLLTPMSIRLPEEDQKTFDGMWNNMLTPVSRVGHQTLLDTLVVYMMFQLGVDRLHVVSEKYLDHGKVVMDIDCDRASPGTDQFTITVVDDRGRTLRRERYSREDVEESTQTMAPWLTASPLERPPCNFRHSSTQPTTSPAASTEPTTRPETPEERQLRLEYERRANAVQAATQPATLR